MSPPKYDQPRPEIPAGLMREVEVESGHMCAVARCGEHTYLEVHHINQNREDNRIENLILLCDKHHKMAHAGVVDRKALAQCLSPQPRSMTRFMLPPPSAASGRSGMIRSLPRVLAATVRGASSSHVPLTAASHFGTRQNSRRSPGSGQHTMPHFHRSPTGPWAHDQLTRQATAQPTHGCILSHSYYSLST
jgi:HNH endonuclease